LALINKNSRMIPGLVESLCYLKPFLWANGHTKSAAFAFIDVNYHFFHKNILAL